MNPAAVSLIRTLQAKYKAPWWARLFGILAPNWLDGYKREAWARIADTVRAQVRDLFKIL